MGEASNDLSRQRRMRAVPTENPESAEKSRVLGWATVGAPQNLILSGYIVSTEGGGAGGFAQRFVIGFGAGTTEMDTVVEGYVMTPQGLRKISETLHSAQACLPFVYVMLARAATIVGAPKDLIELRSTQIRTLPRLKPGSTNCVDMIELVLRLMDVEDGDADEAQSHFPRDSTESRHRFQRSYVPARRSGRVESDEARDAPERRERDIVGSSSC